VATGASHGAKGERGVLDLLRYLNTNYVKKDRGFGEEEMDNILSAVAGAPAVDFYERYIDGEEIPDPAAFLEVIGYVAEKGRFRPVDQPSEAQLLARRDFFSISGKP